MSQPRTFGRRGSANRAPPRAAKKPPMPAPAPSQAPAAAERVLRSTPHEPSVDDELRTWKQERQRHAFFRVPWRQLSLMASLCFLIASFALPDSVNDAVDWLLYLLSAASFWAWFSGRKRRSRDSNPAPSRPPAAGIAP